MMKLAILISMIVGSFVNLISQQLDSLFKGKHLPNGLTVSIKYETNDIPDFNRSSIAIVTFAHEKFTVKYNVFRFAPSDSLEFEAALAKHWMNSGCNVVLHNDPDKNFTDFNKGGFFFLPQFCPCRTVDKESCGELAKSINVWRRSQE